MATLTTTVTTNNFNTRLNSVKGRTETLRDLISELIVFGLEHIQESGNTVYLTKVMEVCKGTRSLPTNAIKDYIKVHCSNLVYGKDKAGNFVFKKEVKGKECAVTMPTVAWYDHESAAKAQAQADYDETARAKSLLTALTKALKEGKVKDPAKATALQAALSDVLAA